LTSGEIQRLRPFSCLRYTTLAVYAYHQGASSTNLFTVATNIGRDIE